METVKEEQPMKREYAVSHLNAMREILDKIEKTGDLFYVWELSGYVSAFQEDIDDNDDFKIED